MLWPRDEEAHWCSIEKLKDLERRGDGVGELKKEYYQVTNIFFFYQMEKTWSSSFTDSVGTGFVLLKHSANCRLYIIEEAWGGYYTHIALTHTHNHTHTHTQSSTCLVTLFFWVSKQCMVCPLVHDWFCVGSPPAGRLAGINNNYCFNTKINALVTSL